MSKYRFAAVLACSCLLITGVVTAQATKAAESASRHKGQLRMVVILSRHGVRSSTWTQARLDSYSAKPWPHWGVPPGDLTNRGYELIKRFANFDRTSLAQAGLFAAQGCEDASKVYIWADTDQRTIATGKALAEGLFPGCPPAVHGLAPGEIDPLFHPAARGVEPSIADAAFAELQAKLKQPDNSERNNLLAEMNHVLLGCAPKIACTPLHLPEVQWSGMPTTASRGKGDHAVDLHGPLAQASSFSEDFLLEYADGMPMDQVGWGQVDEVQLRRFLALHSDYFDLIHRTPALARIEASNMLFYIERTLLQQVEHRPVSDAFGPPDSKAVLLAGHDTNLAGVAALLGLHWSLDGRNDDTPPGTELMFELWQDERGSYSVQVVVAMQTLRQLREMQNLTPLAPPAGERLNLRGCDQSPLCSWSAFRGIVDAAAGNSTVIAAQAR